MDMTWSMPSPAPVRESQRGSDSTRRRRFDRQPRSRTGCITCRARHKRCDERTPTCQNCETLNIRCEGYNAQLRWQEKYMRMADIPDTSYRSLRYINVSRERFSEEMERLMEEFSPYDVDHRNDSVRHRVKAEIVDLDDMAYMYGPAVSSSHGDLDPHNFPQYNLSHNDELYLNGLPPKLPAAPDMFTLVAHRPMPEAEESNYLYISPSNVPLTSEFVYAPATVLPSSSIELISSLEPQLFY
ncbi:hypothetical protein V1520DRAFT_179884 [Lipomyces starkeyi]|uniref:Zn(2)-C6 fungal-type domain-containing protein n=1 Tax=Lipomyces starkeyi NRRL Y-11557 TaxID=675824 RepID=A0A1E3Q082_LIPST|nr:hypothetical protein LIPSTDRAFT_146974 [Lipomyces starkeyi NRRL Y-11557]